MHMQNVGATGALVQIVDVLSDQRHPALPGALQFCEGQMCRVWLKSLGQKLAASSIVEAVDQLGIASEGARCRNIFQVHFGPDAVRIAEGGEARFPGYTGTREDNNVLEHTAKLILGLRRISEQLPALDQLPLGGRSRIAGIRSSAALDQQDVNFLRCYRPMLDASRNDE